MILVASVVGGALIGWFLGWNRRGVGVFMALWCLVFAVQTVVLLSTADDPRDRATGEWDLGYFPFALCVLAGGLVVLGAVAALGRRRRTTEVVTRS